MGLAFSRIWERMFGKKEMRILMVGLDAAGKTTILYKLKLGEALSPRPSTRAPPNNLHGSRAPPPRGAPATLCRPAARCWAPRQAPRARPRRIRFSRPASNTAPS